MSDSYKNFSTNLEKKKLRKKREEHVEWRTAREKLERDEWERMKNLRAYLQDKGIED